MPYADKSLVANAIGAINWHYRGQGKNLILLAPGRIGTSSKELGVPTTFADISEFDTICEVAEDRAGYRPELSYGSHIFQDLVEAQILYVAVFQNNKTIHYCPEKLKELPNHLLEVYPEGKGLEDIVGLYLVDQEDAYLYHDMNEERIVCTIHEQKPEKAE